MTLRATWYQYVRELQPTQMTDIQCCMLQEDSHEFLRCLLEKMHRVCLKQAGVKEGSKDRRDETDDVHNIFGGWFRNQLHCPECKYDSNSFEAFMDLSLEVGNGIVTVQRALQKFASIEVLDEDNKWKCPRCTKAVRARKQLTIRKVCFLVCEANTMHIWGVLEFAQPSQLANTFFSHVVCSRHQSLPSSSSASATCPSPQVWLRGRTHTHTHTPSFDPSRLDRTTAVSQFSVSTVS